MISAAAVALVTIAPSANAASSYVSLFGGASLLSSVKSSGHMVTTTGYIRNEHASSSFKTGFVVGGNMGVDWGTFRTEIELGIRQNNASKAKASFSYSSGTGLQGPIDISPTSVDLNLRSYSLMANVWYDFKDVLPNGITPYVGGGLGFAEVQLSGKVNGAKIHQSNSSDFAWQVGAGLSIPVSDTVKLFADYRYTDLGSATLNFRPSGLKLNQNGAISGHNILVGFRVNL